MKLIKLEKNIYTIDKKYFVPNNYKLKCELASKTHPDIFDVDPSFFTGMVTETEYEVEGDFVRITFPVMDVIVEIFLDLSLGEVKVMFDYLPAEIEKAVTSEVEKFLEGILKRKNYLCCDACRRKHQAIIIGTCQGFYWE